MGQRKRRRAAYLSPIAPEKLRELLGAVVEYGHYVVLVALLAQTALFSLDRMGSRPKPATES